jgi:4-hydroxy-tetrahydrodipicolinate synthase
MTKKIQGVIAAAVTPLNEDLSFDLEGQLLLLRFLAQRGCHGALIFGTTGEGPSFSPQERLVLLRNAVAFRQEFPDFVLLAGTGTPSLDETNYLTRQCFELGYDSVVVLPPYYYKNATDDGLFNWFSQVIRKSVPEDGMLLGYHIPRVSAVALSLDLLKRLKESFPDQFAGLKDSGGDPTFAQQLGNEFGASLKVFTGNDHLFSLALDAHACGCITAAANILSPLHRIIWDSHQSGMIADETQTQLTTKHIVISQTAIFPPLIKALLHYQYHLPNWPVYPPLTQTPLPFVKKIMDELQPLG